MEPDPQEHWTRPRAGGVAGASCGGHREIPRAESSHETERRKNSNHSQERSQCVLSVAQAPQNCHITTCTSACKPQISPLNAPASDCCGAISFHPPASPSTKTPHVQHLQTENNKAFCHLKRNSASATSQSSLASSHTTSSHLAGLWTKWNHP